MQKEHTDRMLHIAFMKTTTVAKVLQLEMTSRVRLDEAHPRLQVECSSVPYLRLCISLEKESVKNVKYLRPLYPVILISMSLNLRTQPLGVLEIMSKCVDEQVRRKDLKALCLSGMNLD